MARRRVDLGHPRSIGAVGVDVAVDGLAVGRMGGRRGDRVGRAVEPISADSTAFARYATSPTPVIRDARVRDRAPGRRDDGTHADDRIARRRVGHLLVRPLDPAGQRPARIELRGSRPVRCRSGRHPGRTRRAARPVRPASTAARPSSRARARAPAGRCRVGVGDRPTDRAPVADLDVADAEDALAGEVERGRLQRLRVGRRAPRPPSHHPRSGRALAARPDGRYRRASPAARAAASSAAAGSSRRR